MSNQDENTFDFTQRLRRRVAVQLLPEDVTQQDPKMTALGIKVLRDMDSTEVGVKRLALDNKIAGDNAAVARELIRATYDHIANGVTPFRTVNPAPESADGQLPFEMPEDIYPEFEPNEEIKAVGVADRTYDEIMATAPPKPSN